MSGKVSPQPSPSTKRKSHSHTEEQDHQLIRELRNELQNDDKLLKLLEKGLNELREDRDNLQKKLVQKEKELQDKENEIEDIKEKAKEFVAMKKEDFRQQAQEYVKKIEQEKQALDQKYKKYKKMAKAQKEAAPQPTQPAPSTTTNNNNNKELLEENSRLKQRLETVDVKNKRVLQEYREYLRKIELAIFPDELVRFLYGKELGAEKISFNNARFSGTMFKQGSTFKSWKERFFCLADNFLFYFENQKSPMPLGYVHLVNHSAIKQKGDRENMFKIVIKSAQTTKELLYSAKSPNDRDSWVEQINNCIPWWDKSG